MNAHDSEDALLALGEHVVRRAQELGADEVAVGVSQGSHVNLTRRDGRVEQATEAYTKRLSLALLANDKFSSHSTCDLRPEALDRFLQNAVAATQYLEPDPDRKLPPSEECGRGASEAALEHLDPSYASYTADDRANTAESLEQQIEALRDDSFVSASIWVSDGEGRSAEVTSNGFADTTHAAWFATGATVTLSEDNGRRPEGTAWYAARHQSDIPALDHIAADAVARAREAVGSGAIDSGNYPMILLNRSVGRILGTLGGPISGGSLHYGRSCLADKLGEKIGSDKLTLIDDPTIPRGLGSTPWDGDQRVATKRTIIHEGELRSYYIGTYFGRKLGMERTTDSRTNWVLPPGDQSWEEIAKAFPKAILVTGFMGGNANGLTGDFSFGIRGQLLEHGKPTQSLSEMNVSGNTLKIFHQLAAVANDPWKYSSLVSPTLVFEDVAFSGA